MKEKIYIDPRLRLILVPLVGIITFSTTDKLYFMVLAWGVALIMFLSGVKKTTVKLLVLVMGAFLLQILLENLEIPALGTLVIAILYVLQRFMLFAMLGASVSKTLTIGEIICTMEKLKIPRQIVIPIAVTLRFVPTIRQEFGYIKDCMRIRGIECGFIESMIHPIVWIEYLLVPILMRSFKIADELSAAAMVRGIECQGEKTLLYDFKWNALSTIILIAFVGYGIGICLL